MNTTEDYSPYSVTKHGTRGWFWVAWQHWDEPYQGVPPAFEGTAATELEAHNAARQACGYGPYAGPLHGTGSQKVWQEQHRLKAAYAGRVLQRRAYTERMSRPAASSGAQSAGVVYKRYHSTPDDSRFPDYTSYTPHRIIRSTARFVWVCDEPVGRDTWYIEHPDALRTYRLDRAALAAGEYHRAEDGWWGGTYVLAVPEAAVEESDGRWVLYDVRASRATARTPEETPACLRALGLAYPCTTEDVDRAYKARALAAHPDTGGSHEAFLALGEVYAAAQRLVRV